VASAAALVAAEGQQPVGPWGGREQAQLPVASRGKRERSAGSHAHEILIPHMLRQQLCTETKRVELSHRSKARARSLCA
jgi:hypothetical protein